MIDTTVDQCYESQVATKGDREKTIKVTNIPNRHWDTVATDNGGSHPNGHYNLVLIDKRSGFPVIKYVPLADFQTNKERLKYIFATTGLTRRIESATTDHHSSLKNSRSLQSKNDFNNTV